MSVEAVERGLQAGLVQAVQEAMVAEATRRVAQGEAPVASKAQQEALAGAVLEREFRRLDTERIAAGLVRLSEVDEAVLVERVVAETVGLGPVDVLMGDPTVEEVVATRWIWCS